MKIKNLKFDIYYITDSEKKTKNLSNKQNIFLLSQDDAIVLFLLLFVQIYLTKLCLTRKESIWQKKTKMKSFLLFRFVSEKQ